MSACMLLYAQTIVIIPHVSSINLVWFIVQ